jgi:hypothetical protein
LKRSATDGPFTRPSIAGLPDIDLRVGIALAAEDLRIGMTASAVPDVEDPAFLTKRLSATIANHNGFVFAAYLAVPAFGYGDHKGFAFQNYI